MLSRSHALMQAATVLSWGDTVQLGAVAMPGACWQEKFGPGSETTLIQQMEIRVCKVTPPSSAQTGLDNVFPLRRQTLPVCPSSIAHITDVAFPLGTSISGAVLWVWGWG